MSTQFYQGSIEEGSKVIHVQNQRRTVTLKIIRKYFAFYCQIKLTLDFRPVSLNICNELENNQDNFPICNNSNDENEVLSFEGLMKQNKQTQLFALNLDLCDDKGIDIDEFTDSEYQYLKPILYVELAAIFDQYKIEFLKRKASTKLKGKQFPGCYLICDSP